MKPSYGLDLEKKQAVRKADREHRTMLQYKTLLAESKTPLLLAQKEIASLQKELDSFRKAVDAKAKDAMERHGARGEGVALTFTRLALITEKVVSAILSVLFAAIDEAVSDGRRRRGVASTSRPGDASADVAAIFMRHPRRSQISATTPRDARTVLDETRAREPRIEAPHLTSAGGKADHNYQTHAKEQERIAYRWRPSWPPLKMKRSSSASRSTSSKKERKVRRRGAEEQRVYTACLEEVKLRDMQIGQLQKEIGSSGRASSSSSSTCMKL